jgi:carbon monoxide dehydrogenase subunit G
MDITGEYSFDIPQERVWEVLQDPKALSLIIPLIMNVKQVGDNQYTGTLFFKVGTIAGTFHGKIELLNMQPPNSYDVKVHGKSAVGEVNIVGGMRLEAQEQGTLMHYQGDVQYNGRIASVGSRVLEVATRAIIQKSFETLSRYLSIKYKHT